MSEIEFQNGFICGMATRGLTKGIPSVKIISASNGYNGKLSTWILADVSIDLGPVVSNENTEAFRVIGYKDWTLKIYTVYEVIRVDSNTIGIRTDNFDEVDQLLEIHYMEKSGTLKTASGLAINDMAATFYVTFANPKLKLRASIPFVDVSNVGEITVSASLALLDDLIATGSETIGFIDISAIGTVTTSCTITVL